MKVRDLLYNKYEMRKAIAKFLYISTWPIWLMFFKFFIHYKVVGRDKLKKNFGDRPVLVVANHLTWFDPFMLGATFPMFSSVYPIRYLTKSSLFRVPFIGQMVWLYGSVKVVRGIGIENSLKEAVSILKNNGTVGIFPEGKIRRDKGFQKAKKGVAYLAKQTNPIIIPIYISNGFCISAKEIFLRKRHITLYVGNPFEVDNFEEGLDNTAQHIMDKVNILKEDER